MKRPDFRWAVAQNGQDVVRAQLFQAQSGVKVLNDSVTLASDFFEHLAVQDFYGSAHVFD
jgi:hypothetical protein